jgi:DNA-binding SARP family transcriptional activator
MRLFGPIEVQVDGRPLPRLRSRKGHWLLALLALRHGAEVDRAWLAGVLWPDSGEPQALAGLRNSLMDLRRALGAQAARLQSPSLHTLCLDLEGAEVDVLRFDGAIAAGDSVSLERAVALYRGPLLEGCVEEWVPQERETRAQACLAALERLAAEAEARSDPMAAERCLRRAVAMDPTRETAGRALMRLLAASGNYAAATQTYRDLRLLLHRELNVEPDAETRALYEQLRAEARSKAALGSGGQRPEAVVLALCEGNGSSLAPATSLGRFTHGSEPGASARSTEPSAEAGHPHMVGKGTDGGPRSASGASLLQLTALRDPPLPAWPGPAATGPEAERVASPPLSPVEAVGGAVPLESGLYVVRPTDDEFQAAIARRDSIVLVKGARQMGKTSLLGRGLEQARRAGARVVFTDFQQLNAESLASVDAFFRTLGAWIADQLELELFPDQAWDDRFGPSMNFSRYVRRHVLGADRPPLVWGLDEVDLLLGCDFSSEAFGLWRSWHNQRVTDPAGPWSRLTLAIAYATEAHLFIANINQSPFNVGTRVTLEDFTLDQVADLNRRHGAPLATDGAVERFHRLLNGQPYLVRRGLYEMAARGLDPGALEAQADRDDGVFGDHLRRILAVLAESPELQAVLREVLQGRPCPTQESFFRLRSAGILAGENAREVRPRCPLYGAYLARHLL